MAAVLIDPNGASEPTSQLPPGGCCDDHLNPPEAALRDLRQAEAALSKTQAETRETATELDAELRTASSDLGRRLPELWHGAGLATAHKKALLRCLIDKIVIHRIKPDTVHLRIVWRGGGQRLRCCRLGRLARRHVALPGDGSAPSRTGAGGPG